MHITFLGTGDSGGVPRPGCNCTACRLARVEGDYRRGPSSVLIHAGKTRILIDAGLFDLGERFPPGSLSAIVLTHFHPDHVLGLFHLRWGVGKRISVYAPPDLEGCADLYKNPGLLEFHRLAPFETVVIGNLHLTPLPLIHSKLTFGYVLEGADGCRFAYLTDTDGLEPQTDEYLRCHPVDGLAIDCSFPPREESLNHNGWNQALDAIQRVKSKQSWMTHIGHTLDSWLQESEQTIPDGVQIARDGWIVELLPGHIKQLSHER
jgi:phosphoribosyl 1,2-cyclic phosphate phosphodiesterase